MLMLKKSLDRVLFKNFFSLEFFPVKPLFTHEDGHAESWSESFGFALFADQNFSLNTPS